MNPHKPRALIITLYHIQIAFFK